MATNNHIRSINPATLSQPTGYSHVVESVGGRTIYISGQIALDAAGQLVGRGDLRAQTHQVFANLQAALEAAGASFDDVVKLTYFCVDIAQMAIVREVRNEYLNATSPPASSAVEVSRLVSEDWLIEIEAVAVASA